MRAVEFLSEAPLADYVPLGFDKKGTQFKPVDKRLVQHPVNKLKTIKFLEKTPYDFRLFFIDTPGLKKYRESGVKTPEQIQQIFGKDADQILANSDNAITIAFIGNYGDQAVMMTPWIMAHRFGHAIQAGIRNTYGGRNTKDTWTQAEDYFFKYINKILKDYYRKSASNDYSTQVNWQLRFEYNALFNAIGTQRSSREGQIKRPYEFLYELFAQYLKDGHVTLNPIPPSVDYGRKAWGRPTKYMGLSPEMREDDIYREQISDELANNLTSLFNNVLKSAVGKIYVM